jgi:hypothetical protein
MWSGTKPGPNQNDHDRSEALHTSLTAPGSEPMAGGGDY